MKYRSIFKYTLLVFFTSIVIGCDNNDDPLDNDEIIKLVILDEEGKETENAIGNGSDQIVLQVELPDKVKEEFKTVTFKATSGTFFGTTENTIKERIDADGITNVSLVLPLDSGDLFLTAEIGSESNSYKAEKQISLIAVDSILNINFKTLSGEPLTSIPRADGTSVFKIESSVFVDRDNLKTVAFSATQGTFIETNEKIISQDIDIDALANVAYQVPMEVGPVFFIVATGSDNEYKDSDNLVFARAHADEIFIEPETLTMTETGGNTITAFLTRSIGKVSLGTDVDFEAFQTVDGDKKMVGRFNGESIAKTDASGKTSVTFLADTGDIDTSLPITISASTMTDIGMTIMVSIDITITEEE